MLFSKRSLCRLFRNVLTNLSRHESTVANAVLYACGNTIICETLEIARQICFRSGERVKAVSLDGTVIHKNGLMTGGTGAEGRSKRWEEKDVASTVFWFYFVGKDTEYHRCLDLKQKREKVTAELVEVQRAKRRLANDEQVLAQLAGLESRLAYARQDEVFTFHDKV